MTPADLKAYLDNLLSKNLSLSTMIWGPPGIGKSSIVAQLASKHQMDFVDVRLSQLAPTELRLRMKSPFFATLALFARVLITESFPTAATDGEDIFINADFVHRLSSSQLDGLLLHEVLHAALLHVPRRGAREPKLWNVAADIVVNGMIAQQQSFELPANAFPVVAMLTHPTW